MSEIESSPGQKLIPASEYSEETLLAAESHQQDSASSVHDADWFTLARKLRQRNRELLKRVADLESALAQMQEEYDGDRPSAPSVASLALLPPNEALQNAQAQINQLFQELEASHTVAQRQQLLIESLAQQLEASQTQVAHWERECQVAKQRHSEQIELLTQATENAQRLNGHLQRQQSQTAQFKVALEQCFTQAEAQSPSPSPLQSVPPTPVEVVAPPEPQPTPPPKGQIAPWSAPTPASQSTTPTTPHWAKRLLGINLAATPSEQTTGEQQPTPPSVQFNRPARPAAPAGKFANLDLPAFNGESESPTPPKVILRQPSQPVPPAAPPVLDAAPNRKLSSIAAVHLPSFPRR